MSWRNGGSLKSADSFATGFAAGFVPAYQSSLDHKRDKEKMAMQEEKDMRLLQERERLARQRIGIRKAGGLSKEAAKAAAKVASSWSEAWSLADIHNIHPSQENMDYIFNYIHGYDGKSNQAANVLSEKLRSNSLVFPDSGERINRPPIVGNAPETTTTTAPVVLKEEEYNGDPASIVPINSGSNTVGDTDADEQTAALLNDVNSTVPKINEITKTKPEGGPPEAVAGAEIDAADRIDQSNGLQVASLGSSALLEVALGQNPEQNVAAVADVINASVNDESEMQPYYGTDLNTIFKITDESDPLYIPLTNMAQAKVLKEISIFDDVTQINEITDIKGIERNLMALSARTDGPAIEMRQKLLQLRRNYAVSGLPNPLEMTRDEAVKFANGGYQVFVNKVPPNALQRVVEEATKVAKMPVETMAYPATAQEQASMLANAKNGRYGPPELWPNGWMAGLADVIQETKLQDMFGSVLDIKTLNGMSIGELEQLSDSIITSGFTDGVPHPIVQDTINFKKASEENSKYFELTKGVNTSADTLVIMNRLDTENAAALNEGLPLPHDEDTLSAIATLHDNMLGREAKARSAEFGIEKVGSMRKAVVMIENKTTGEMEPKLRYAVQGATMNEWKPLNGADWSEENYVAWADDTAIKALDNWNNDMQIERRDLRGKQAVLRNTLQTVDRMSQIVEETNGSVLQAGAAVAQAANTLAFGTASIADVVGQWFKENPAATQITEAQINQAMAQYNQGFDGNYTDWVKDSLPTRELGAQRARFEGLAILATFRLGAANDQTGQAMSNKDFERLKTVLTGTLTVQDFEQKMHDFVNPLIQEEKALQGDLNYKREAFTSTNGFVPERKVQPMADTIEGAASPMAAYDRYSGDFQYKKQEPTEFSSDVYNRVFNADAGDEIGKWREKVYENFEKLSADPNLTDEDRKDAVNAYAAYFKGLDPSEFYGYLKGRYDKGATGQ